MNLITSNPDNLVQAGALVALKLSEPGVEFTRIEPVSTLATINTSSMYTYIREGVATSLGLEPQKSMKIISLTRVGYTTYVYRIRLLFGSGMWVEAEALEVPYLMPFGSDVKCMLGRDVLQHCVLVYNGRTNLVTLDLQIGG